MLAFCFTSLSASRTTAVIGLLDFVLRFGHGSPQVVVLNEFAPEMGLLLFSAAETPESSQTTTLASLAPSEKGFEVWT
jgi:hypothetical protein